jgi:uncharacterized OsmC-like protein
MTATRNGGAQPTPRSPEAEAPAKPRRLNDIDTQQLFDTIDALRADPSKAKCKFFATTRWKHGTVSETSVSRYELGGETIPQNYCISIDEPKELLGTDTAPNPQMALYAALNTCVLNTFIVNAAAKGLKVHSVEMDTEGELDLRGFLGIDESINPGYDELTIVCRVAGEGTQEQFQECLDAGTRYSPNFQSITKPVQVNYRLEMK